MTVNQLYKKLGDLYNNNSKYQIALNWFSVKLGKAEDDAN